MAQIHLSKKQLKKQLRSLSLTHITVVLLIGVLALTNINLNAKELTLNEALKLAQENSLNLKNAQLKLEETKLFETNMQRKMFYPTLDFEMSLDRSKQFDLTKNKSNADATIDNSWQNSSNVTLELSESLYNNGEDSKRYHQAQLERKLAELEYKKELNKLTYNVIDKYLTYTRFVNNLAFDEKFFALTEKQFLIKEKEYRQGLKKRADYVYAKIAYRESKVYIQNAKTEIQNTKTTLLNLINIAASPEEISIIPLQIFRYSNLIDSNGQNFESEKFVNEKMTQFSFVAPLLSTQIEAIKQQSSHLNYLLEKSTNGPQLTLNGSLTYGTDSFINSNNTMTDLRNDDLSEAKISLNFSTKIFDWGIQKRSKEIAYKALLRQQNDSEETLNSEKEKFKIIIDNIRDAYESHLLHGELAMLEKEDYEITEKNYLDGSYKYSTLIDDYKDYRYEIKQENEYWTTLKRNQIDYLYYTGELHDALSNKKYPFINELL